MGKLDPDVRAHVINQLVMIYSNIGGALEKQGHISERRDTVHQSLDDVSSYMPLCALLDLW
mgnify:CR=1 FL=1